VLAHPVWGRVRRFPGTTNHPLGSKCNVWSARNTAKREQTPVGLRGWGPTILVCGAVLLAAVAVEATPGHSHARPPARTDDAVGRGGRTLPAVTTGVATSPNWSGYVAYASSENDGTFDQVSAQWTEPAVTCPTPDAWTLFWVGFDGWPANEPPVERSVEQGGTSARCVNGVPSYSAFYEMWPTQAVTPEFGIHAGDQIDASVVSVPYTVPGQFLITVTDVTSGRSFEVTETCGTGVACPRTSAEWVAESPSHYGTNRWFPLADYGTMDFTKATTTNAQEISGPISDAQWVYSGIERVVGRTQPKAKVSPLQNSGSLFSDTWVRR